MKQLIKRALTFSSALALSLSSLAVLAVPNVSAAQVTKTWDGGGADSNFSTGDNWDDGAAPSVVGNTFILIFPATAPAASRGANNDLTDLKVDEIRFTGAYNGDPYTISGNSITIAGAGAINNQSTGAVADHTISADIVFDGVGGTGPTISNGNNVDAVLTLTGTVSIASGATLSVSSATITDTDNQQGKVVFDSSISGAGALTVASGITQLNASNAYSGITSVSEGATLHVGSGASLGNATGKTVITSGGTLVASTLIPNESIEVSGFGNTQFGTATGAIVSNVDNLVLDQVTLLADAGICAVTDREIDLTSPVLGEYTLYKMNNTACPGAETVDGADTLVVYTGIPDEPVDPEACSELTGTVTIADGSCGKVTSPITGDITVTGTLYGTSTITGNVTTTDTGTIAPGLSPGCLTVDGDVAMVSGSSLDIEIGGATVCSSYDQLQVSDAGTVNLGNATLNVSAYSNFVPAVGDTFTIISNAGSDAITGIFTGRAEGATFTVGGVTYSISYTGGDGNDVVLTVTAVTTTPPTGGAGGEPATPESATPAPAPKVPDTGFGAMLTNPATIMFSTTSIAAAILALARKYNLLKI